MSRNSRRSLREFDHRARNLSSPAKPSVLKATFDCARIARIYERTRFLPLRAIQFSYLSLLSPAVSGLRISLNHVEVKCLARLSRIAVGCCVCVALSTGTREDGSIRTPVDSRRLRWLKVKSAIVLRTRVLRPFALRRERSLLAFSTHRSKHDTRCHRRIIVEHVVLSTFVFFARRNARCTDRDDLCPR